MAVPGLGPGVRLPDGTEYTSDGHDTYRIVEGEPLSAEAVSLRAFRFHGPAGDVRVEAWGRMTGTEDEFVLEHTLQVSEDEQTVASRRWEARRPRHGV